MGSKAQPLTLDEAVELIIDHRGRTPKKLGGDFSQAGVQVVSAKNVHGGRLHLDENRRFVPREMAQRWMRSRLMPHDVLLTSEAPLGEAAYLKGGADVCLGQRLFALRAREGITHGRFLYYALRSPVMQRRLNARATGTTAQGIKQSELRKVEIELPPVDEQERIASVLGALDDKIDSNRRLAGLLEQTAAELFRARFVDFIGVEEFEDSEIGRVPVGWRAGALVELARLRYGKALPAPKRTPGPVAVVGSSGVVGNHSTSLVPGPVVVVGRKGTVGSVVWVGRDAWPIDTTFYADPRDGVEPVFLFFALRDADLVQLTADSAVPGLNREAAERRVLLLPPQEAIREFEALARPQFKARDSLLGEAATLERIREALLPKLISGEIRVPDNADVTESPAEPIAAPGP